MKSDLDPVGKWLDTATKAIRFKPDRKEDVYKRQHVDN